WMFATGLVRILVLMSIVVGLQATAIDFKDRAIDFRAKEGQTTFEVKFADRLKNVAPGQPVSYSSPDLPAWAKLDPKTGVMSGTVPAQPFAVVFTLVVTQGQSSSQAQVRIRNKAIEPTEPIAFSADRFPFRPNPEKGFRIPLKKLLRLQSYNP